MGLLGKLFGGDKHDRPPLDPADPAATRLGANRATLDAFAKKLHDRLEFVPAEKITWVLIGHPPDAFGIAWFEGTEEHNLKRLMAEKKLPQVRIEKIAEDLQKVYRRTMDEPRFSYELGGKKVVVTPSSTLASDIEGVIHAVEP